VGVLVSAIWRLMYFANSVASVQITLHFHFTLRQPAEKGAPRKCPLTLDDYPPTV
jgi:hypothetical protein